MHTDLATIKDILGITGTEFDTVITDLIASYSAWVEGEIGRAILKTTYTDEIHDSGDAHTYLFNYPIDLGAAFTAEARQGDIDAPTWVAIPASDYAVYPDGGFIQWLRSPNRSFSASGARDLRFTYDAGFDTIPADLSGLANQLVVRAFQIRRSHGISEEQVEGSSIQFATFIGGSVGSRGGGIVLTEEQLATLARYRRYNMPHRL